MWMIFYTLRDLMTILGTGQGRRPDCCPGKPVKTILHQLRSAKHDQHFFVSRRILEYNIDINIELFLS